MTTTNKTPRTKCITKADELRAALKVAGIKANQVTVKYDGSTLRVTVRDAAVSISAVEEIANGFEKVSRCHATGEILCGGNTYVDVRYVDTAIAPVAAVIEALLLTTGEGRTVVLGGGFTAHWTGDRYRQIVTYDGPGLDRSMFCYDISGAAKRIAALYLNARAVAA